MAVKVLELHHHGIRIGPSETEVKKAFAFYQLLEGGKRSATLWATTPVRAVVVPPDAIDQSKLEELAAGRRADG